MVTGSNEYLMFAQVSDHIPENTPTATNKHNDDDDDDDDDDDNDND